MSNRNQNKPNLANRMSLFSESQTIAMAKAGRALAAEGKPIINLSFGEPDFDTPEYIKNAAKLAIDNGYTKYTPVPGMPELRDAICAKFERENNLIFKQNQIVVSTGAKQSLMNVMHALVNPKDEVIIPTPYWVSYNDMVKFVDGKPVYINAHIEMDFKITPEQLGNAITPKSKLFVFSSPSNPTGSIYSKSELKQLAAVFAKNPHVFIISDEIYEHINYIGKHESIAQFENIKDRVITVNGLSKGYAMTGWRLGYLAAHEDIAFACEKIQGQFTSGTNAMTQKAAITALGEDLSATLKMKDTFLQRRNFMIKELSSIEGIEINEPEGAFYLFPKINHFFGKKHGNEIIKSAADLCMYILHTAYVTTVNGAAFGAADYIRISYAADTEDLKTACKNIKETLAKLK